MTGSEAIKELQDNIDLPFGVSVSDETSRMAINALEKQIPKKPHKNFAKFSGVWCSCGKYLDFVDKPNYCSDCGQKIDWSDEE